MDQTKQWDAVSILQFLADHIDDLQAMGVRKIGLFGSYIRTPLAIWILSLKWII